MYSSSPVHIHDTRRAILEPSHREGCRSCFVFEIVLYCFMSNTIGIEQMNDRTHILNINVPKGTNVRTTVTPPRVFKNMDYLRFFSEGLQELILDKELTRTDIVVMLYCCTISGFENRFTISQQQISDTCELSRSEVNKSIKKLKQKGWISIVGSIGRQNIYMINPKLAFKSRALNYNGIVSEYEELAVI